MSSWSQRRVALQPRALHFAQLQALLLCVPHPRYHFTTAQGGASVAP